MSGNGNCPPNLAGLGTEWEFAGSGRPRKTVPGQNSLPTKTAKQVGISRKQKHWCIRLASIPEDERGRIMALPTLRERNAARAIYRKDNRGSVKLPRELFDLLSSVVHPGVSVSDRAVRLIVHGIQVELADADCRETMRQYAEEAAGLQTDGGRL
jgi:hypothetical protein